MIPYVENMEADMHILHFHRPALVTANIEYGLPDYPSILQQYIWQNEDFVPSYPELRRFLDFWDRNLEGRIRRVHVASRSLIDPRMRIADFVRTIN